MEERESSSGRAHSDPLSSAAEERVRERRLSVSPNPHRTLNLNPFDPSPSRLDRSRGSVSMEHGIVGWDPPTPEARDEGDQHEQTTEAAHDGGADGQIGL